MSDLLFDADGAEGRQGMSGADETVHTLAGRGCRSRKERSFAVLPLPLLPPFPLFSPPRATSMHSRDPSTTGATASYIACPKDETLSTSSSVLDGVSVENTLSPRIIKRFLPDESDIEPDADGEDDDGDDDDFSGALPCCPPRARPHAGQSRSRLP